jgi:hypothetical protein
MEAAKAECIRCAQARPAVPLPKLHAAVKYVLLPAALCLLTAYDNVMSHACALLGHTH